MAQLPHKDLVYWHREFKHLLSGWPVEQQIQFHQYAIAQLKKANKGGDQCN